MSAAPIYADALLFIRTSHYSPLCCCSGRAAYESNYQFFFLILCNELTVYAFPATGSPLRKMFSDSDIVFSMQNMSRSFFKIRTGEKTDLRTMTALQLISSIQHSIFSYQSVAEQPDRTCKCNHIISKSVRLSAMPSSTSQSPWLESGFLSLRAQQQ